MPYPTTLTLTTPSIKCRYIVPADFTPAPGPVVHPTDYYDGFVRANDRGVGIRNYGV